MITYDTQYRSTACQLWSSNILTSNSQIRQCSTEWTH